MNAEWLLWFQYAEENRQVAALCFEEELFNPCLQNVQQAVEKALKALCIAAGLSVKKTHSIRELVADLRKVGVKFNFGEEDIDLLDSIYLPSKYPLGSALPDFNPDISLARRCLTLMNEILNEARKNVKTDKSGSKNHKNQGKSP